MFSRMRSLIAISSSCRLPYGALLFNCCKICNKCKKLLFGRRNGSRQKLGVFWGPKLPITIQVHRLAGLLYMENFLQHHCHRTAQFILAVCIEHFVPELLCCGLATLRAMVRLLFPAIIAFIAWCLGPCIVI